MTVEEAYGALLKKIKTGGVTPSQIKQYVDEYMTEHPTEISPDTGNIFEKRANGFYVPETDLSAYAKSADIKFKIMPLNVALTEQDLLDKIVQNEGVECSGFFYNADTNEYCEFEGLYSPIVVSGETIHFGWCHITGLHKSDYSVDYLIDDEDGDTWYKRTPNDYIDFSDYVQKVTGKDLSSNDYTDADKAEVEKIKDKADKTEIPTDYVKQEDGKGLSSNDYTDDDKAEVEKVKDKADKTELDDYAKQEDLDDKLDSDLGNIDDAGIQAIKDLISQLAGSENIKAFYYVTPTWEESEDFADFPYKGTIECEGIDATFMPIISFTESQQKSSKYKPYCVSDVNKVYIYAKEAVAEVIPGVFCIREGVNEGSDLSHLIMQMITDLKMLGWTVPAECSVQNSVEGNKFIQRVGRVDLGSLKWTKYNVAQGTLFRTPLLTNMKAFDNYSVISAYLYGYVATSSNARTEKSISNTTVGFDIVDSDYAEVTDFTSGMQGKYLYYELETPIETSIDGNEVISEVDEKIAQKELELAELKMLGWTVPNDSPVKNSVNGNVFTQRVGRIELGNLAWAVNSYSSKPYSFVTHDYDVPDAVVCENTDDKIRCYSPDFATDSAVNTIAKAVLYKIAVISQHRIYMYSSAETADDLKVELQGKYLYYELETPITTQIDGNEIIKQLDDSVNGFQLREVDGKAQYKLKGEGADAWRFFSQGGELVYETGTVDPQGYKEFRTGNCFALHSTTAITSAIKSASGFRSGGIVADGHITNLFETASYAEIIYQSTRIVFRNTTNNATYYAIAYIPE